MRRWLLGGLSLVVAFAGLVWFRARADRWLAGVIERVAERNLEVVEARTSADIGRALQRNATAETAAFVEENMLAVRSFPDQWALLEHSLKAVDPKLGGLYCEFGVASGHSINFMAERTVGPVHGFDSFEGLPADWRDGYEKGKFAMPALPAVRSNVVLHKGWFQNSLPEFKAQHPEPMAMLHLDADLYSSTRDVLEILGERIVPGTVMQFDEFFNYPGWKTHEFRAFQEFVQKRGVRYEYLGYARANQQVAVRILSLDPVRPRPGGNQ